MIKPLELNALYSKFDTICIIFTVFFVIFFIFGSGLIYYIFLLLRKEKKKNTNIIEVNINDNNVNISKDTNKKSIDESGINISGVINNSIISNCNDRVSIPVKTDNSTMIEENKQYKTSESGRKAQKKYDAINYKMVSVKMKKDNAIALDEYIKNNHIASKNSFIIDLINDKINYKK